MLGLFKTAEIAKIVPYPVFIQNDATSACGAELVFGKGTKYTDFAYFYIGSFVGGGVVLNGNLYPGRTGYAGAMGPIPVPGPIGRAGRSSPSRPPEPSARSCEDPFHEPDGRSQAAAGPRA